MKSPPGIRPTEDRVRKAVFDILGPCEGISFLELFAGTGSVGLEALSRGAAKVVFVEEDGIRCRILSENVKQISPSARVDILREDALGAVRKMASMKAVFDIVFADPPYYGSLGQKILQTLGEYDIVSPSGNFIIQHFKKDILPDTVAGLHVYRKARYGDTIVSFYEKNNSYAP